MTWLTQITLDHATVARRHLRDNYDWHQAAWQCFPGRPNARTRFPHAPRQITARLPPPDRFAAPSQTPGVVPAERLAIPRDFIRLLWALALRLPTPRKCD